MHAVRSEPAGLGRKTKAPPTQVRVWGRPSNSPPPELLTRSLDFLLLDVNGSGVPATGTRGLRSKQNQS